MLKMLAVALVGTGAALLLKNTRSELALLVGGVTALVLFLMALEPIGAVRTVMEELMDRFGTASSYLGSVLKIVGLACLTRFGAALCRDAGQGATAVKLELGGRALILLATVPELYALLRLGLSLLDGAFS